MHRLVVLKHCYDYDKTRNMSDKCSVNEFKLDNNLIRGKNTVLEIAICNDWQYFVTLTLNPGKYDREDLKQYIKELAQFIRNQKRKYKADIKYLLIPELHSDGKSWHLHGLINGLTDDMLQPTGHKDYMTWFDYQEKFGYMSLSVIQDAIRASFYIRKYVTKTFADSPLSLGLHTYYASQGLKRAEKTWLEGQAVYDNFWNVLYENDFCVLYDITNEQAVEMMGKYKMDIPDKIKMEV